MKLVINYDFFNAILDINDGFTPMKIVRNNKKTLVIMSSSFFALDYFVTHNIPTSINLTMLQDLSFFIGTYACKYLYHLNDPYKAIAIKRLHELVIELKELHINTDYDLLLKSELLEKKYKVQINKENVLSLIENKYILVPTYDFNGNVKTTSILQEHEIGTSDYVLSIGSPKKELKLARASI